MKKFRTKKKDTYRNLASGILEIFEEKLEELNISLPDDQREGRQDEARIYGENYYDLLDEISDFIKLNKRCII